MNFKGVCKTRITDDLKYVSLLRQLFKVDDSVEDLDLILEMASHGITDEDVIKKFDNEFINSLGDKGEEFRKGFADFLSDYTNSPQSLDNTIYEYCVNSSINFSEAVDALNQWLPTQLKYELVECF